MLEVLWLSLGGVSFLVEEVRFLKMVRGFNREIDLAFFFLSFILEADVDEFVFDDDDVDDGVEGAVVVVVIGVVGSSSFFKTNFL